MKKSYVFKQDFKAPYVVATGLPHRPTKIMLKKYKRGQIIQGQMVMAKGKPSVLALIDQVMAERDLLAGVGGVIFVLNALTPSELRRPVWSAARSPLKTT